MMGVREEQKEKRRGEILNAGLDLFIRKGYSATKIDDIANQVGMSVGLMFHYFPSKEKLYEELITLGVEGSMHTMAVAEDEPILFFENTVRSIFTFLKTEPYIAKIFVLMSQAFYSEAVSENVKKLLSGFDVYTPTVTLIKKGQQNGTIRDGDPGALALAFWCSIQGIAMELAIHPQKTCPDSDWIVDIIRRKI